MQGRGSHIAGEAPMFHNNGPMAPRRFAHITVTRMTDLAATKNVAVSRIRFKM